MRPKKWSWGVKKERNVPYSNWQWTGRPKRGPQRHSQILHFGFLIWLVGITHPHRQSASISLTWVNPIIAKRSSYLPLICNRYLPETITMRFSYR